MRRLCTALLLLLLLQGLMAQGEEEAPADPPSDAAPAVDAAPAQPEETAPPAAIETDAPVADAAAAEAAAKEAADAEAAAAEAAAKEAADREAAAAEAAAAEAAAKEAADKAAADAAAAEAAETAAADAAAAAEAPPARPPPVEEVSLAPPPAPTPAPPPARKLGTPITHFATDTKTVSREPRRLVDKATGGEYEPPNDDDTKEARRTAATEALNTAKIPWSFGQWVYSHISDYISDEGPVECAHRCEEHPECHHWNYFCRTANCEFMGEVGIYEDGDPQHGRDFVMTGEATRMRRLKEKPATKDKEKEL